jgi:hypothetical protein
MAESGLFKVPSRQRQVNGTENTTAPSPQRADTVAEALGVSASALDSYPVNSGTIHAVVAALQRLDFGT